MTARAETIVTGTRKKGGVIAVGVLIGILAIVAVVTFAKPNTDYNAYSLRNPEDSGTMALGEILKAQGVDMRQISRLRDARVPDPENTTLVIVRAGYLDEVQSQSIAQYPGDVVVLASSFELRLALGATFDVGDTDAATLDARCNQPDAAAAQTITAGGPVFTYEAPPGATACFGNSYSFAYAQWQDDGRTRTFISDPSIFTNAKLAKEGNAALALRSVGVHESAVWYVGDPFDTSALTWNDGSGDPVEPNTAGNLDMFPPGTGSAMYALALAAGLAAWWRARRFGPLVTEPLPVIIRASEATLGRARLYRKAGATGRAASSLRALAATRIGGRLGLTKTTSGPTLVATIAAATGRETENVQALLYGPAPSTAAELTQLARELDILEDEVHKS